MDDFISIAFLALTALVYMGVAALASRGVASRENYLLGDRSFNIKSITMTLIATQLGAGMIFGTAEEAYSKGVMGIAYVLGMAIGLIVLGLGVGARLRALEISTTAELFEVKYDSKSLRKFASLISILTMGGILAAQIVASRQLFVTLFDLSPIWLVLFWLAIIGYTTFGGMKAIIATDILQVILIVLVFTAVLFYVVPAREFLPLLAYERASSEHSFFANGFFSALMAPVLFSIIEQDLAQRCFAAKTKRVATISSLLAAFFLIIYAFVPIILGSYAAARGVNFVGGQSPLVILLKQNLPPIGMTLVSCALLAAICSTADSLLGAAGTNLIADFLPSEQKNSLLISRLLTLCVGIGAMTIAFNFNNVIAVIITSYEISICTLFVPLLAAIYCQRPSRLGAILSVTSGVVSFLVTTYAASIISPTLIALGISLLGFIIGSLIARLKRSTPAA